MYYNKKADSLRLGIMQGRLLPPVNNQIQTFPLNCWKDEFPRCQELGITCLEWIFEYSTFADNPICSDNGIEEMIRVSGQYEVSINSVIADYFMVKRLFGKNTSEINDALDMLKFIIKQCNKCGIPIIEIPLVDASALETERDKRELVQNLEGPLKVAREHEIRISLETSLPPEEFRDLILAFKPYKVYVNYDMGNSASLGYNASEEISLFGEYIINVHIKDRVKGGGTVPLGVGDTDFKTVFASLAQSNYLGDFILQAARQDLSETENKKNEVETIRDYVTFIQPFLEVVS